MTCINMMKIRNGLMTRPTASHTLYYYYDKPSNAIVYDDFYMRNNYERGQKYTKFYDCFINFFFIFF